MKKIICLLTFIFCYISYGQESLTANFCTQKFIDLNNRFIKEQDSLKKYQEKFEITNKLLLETPSQKQFDQIKILLDSVLHKKAILNSIYKTFESHKIVCSESGFPIQKIDSIFKNYSYIISDSKTLVENNETKIYTYFGKDLVLEEKNIFDKNTPQGRILDEILKESNEKNHFGDFTIPKNNQEFSFYKSEINEKQFHLFKLLKYIFKEETFKKLNGEEFKFKKIELQIEDGSFADIKVYINYKGNTHIFENKVGISFLRFANKSKDHYLFYSQTIIKNNAFDYDKIKDFRIRLGDILVYNYSIGNNYIPSNLSINLPIEDSNLEMTNNSVSVTYQIKEKTSLDKIIELRTYSDFLALFGDNSNGLVQLEANAKFYIFPFPMQYLDYGLQYEVLKSISPHIQYSRFEENNGFVDLSSGNIQDTLGLVEKRFLTMGLIGNFFELKHKDFPVKASLFGSFEYQLTKAKLENDVEENIKASSYGVGLHLSFKKLNNFGLDYRSGLQWFDYKNFNSIPNLIIQDKVPIFKNEAEIFYHPSKNPNQAIFVRLITYNYSGSSNDEAFYQFQFGYKFSLGSRTTVK